jgi:hypothetical protein
MLAWTFEAVQCNMMSFDGLQMQRRGEKRMKKGEIARHKTKAG